MRTFRDFVKEAHTPEQVAAAEKKYSAEYDKHKRNADRNKSNKDKVGALFRNNMSKKDRSEVQYPYDIFKAAQGKQDHKAKLRKRALDIIHRPKKQPEPEPVKQQEPPAPRKEDPRPKQETPKQQPKKKMGLLAALKYSWNH